MIKQHLPPTRSVYAPNSFEHIRTKPTQIQTTPYHLTAFSVINATTGTKTQTITSTHHSTSPEKTVPHQTTTQKTPTPHLLRRDRSTPETKNRPAAPPTTHLNQISQNRTRSSPRPKPEKPQNKKVAEAETDAGERRTNAVSNKTRQSNEKQ
jgi:hypothetical protein